MSDVKRYNPQKFRGDASETYCAAFYKHTNIRADGNAYACCRGEKPITKMEIVNNIAEGLGIESSDLHGLEKSPKAALKSLEKASKSFEKASKVSKKLLQASKKALKASQKLPKASKKHRKASKKLLKAQKSV